MCASHCSLQLYSAVVIMFPGAWMKKKKKPLILKLENPILESNYNSGLFFYPPSPFPCELLQATRPQ